MSGPHLPRGGHSQRGERRIWGAEIGRAPGFTSARDGDQARTRWPIDNAALRKDRPQGDIHFNGRARRRHIGRAATPVSGRHLAGNGRQGGRKQTYRDNEKCDQASKHGQRLQSGAGTARTFTQYRESALPHQLSIPEGGKHAGARPSALVKTHGVNLSSRAGSGTATKASCSTLSRRSQT